MESTGIEVQATKVCNNNCATLDSVACCRFPHAKMTSIEVDSSRLLDRTHTLDR